jgi:hypothetical protein
MGYGIYGLIFIFNEIRRTLTSDQPLTAVITVSLNYFNQLGFASPLAAKKLSDESKYRPA